MLSMYLAVCWLDCLQLPTAKYSAMQVGDGTTTVVILAGEFLRESKPFVEEGVHPQSLIRSFRQAGQLAVQKVKDLSISIEGKSAEEKADMLKKCAMTSLNSKLVCQSK